MKKILVIPQDMYGCGQFRLIQPYRELHNEFSIKLNPKYSFDILFPHKGQSVVLENLKPYDAIVMQRVCTVQQLDLLLKLKEMGKKIIMDVDDDLNLVHPSNDFYKVMNHIKQTTGQDYLKIFETALRMSDYITVTTPEIRNNFKKRYNQSFPIEVVPNAIDLKHPLIQEKYSRRSHLPKDKIVIGWQGGSSHSLDLEIIKNIELILKDNPNVIFAFCSNPLLYQKTFGNASRKTKEQIIFIPPETEFDRYVSIPSMIDIGLAPLQLDNFNKGKSWLKCLEYGIFKVPTICSPIPDYERFNKYSGGNIIVKTNKTADFFKETQKLIDNPERRKKLGEKSFKFIQEYGNLTNYNKLRIEVLDRIFKDA